MTKIESPPPGGTAVNKVWYLKHIDIFDGVQEEDIQALEPYTVHRRFKSKEMIFLPGDQGDKVYFLKEGLVKIAKLSPGGKEVTLAILEPGEIFGEQAYIDGMPRETFAQAMNDILVCIMKRADFQRYVERRPGVGVKITMKMGERVRELEQQLEDLVFRDVPGRLSALILRLADKHGTEPHDEGEMIDLRLTHQEVANLIGSTRESASINISKFKQQGLINIDKHRFVVVDRDGLMDLTEEAT